MLRLRFAALFTYQFEMTKKHWKNGNPRRAKFRGLREQFQTRTVSSQWLFRDITQWPSFILDKGKVVFEDHLSAGLNPHLKAQAGNLWRLKK